MRFLGCFWSRNVYEKHILYHTSTRKQLAESLSGWSRFKFQSFKTRSLGTSKRFQKSIISKLDCKFSKGNQKKKSSKHFRYEIIFEFKKPFLEESRFWKRSFRNFRSPFFEVASANLLELNGWMANLCELCNGNYSPKKCFNEACRRIPLVLLKSSWDRRTCLCQQQIAGRIKRRI